MELPELPRVPFPVRMRRQVQPVQRPGQDLHNPKTPHCKGPMPQLHDPQPSLRPILQELRNKTLTTHAGPLDIIGPTTAEDRRLQADRPHFAGALRPIYSGKIAHSTSQTENLSANSRGVCQRNFETRETRFPLYAAPLNRSKGPRPFNHNNINMDAKTGDLPTRLDTLEG